MLQSMGSKRVGHDLAPEKHAGGRVGRGADPRGELTLDTSPRQSSSVQTHRSFQGCGPKCTMSYAHEGLSGPGESGDPWKEASHHGYEVWLCL